MATTSPPVALYFQAVRPIAGPVDVAPGEWLSVWPVDRSLLVFDADGRRVLRAVLPTHRPAPPSLWPTLRSLVDDDALRPMALTDVYWLRRFARRSATPSRWSATR